MVIQIIDLWYKAVKSHIDLVKPIRNMQEVGRKCSPQNLQSGPQRGSAVRKIQSAVRTFSIAMLGLRDNS